MPRSAATNRTTTVGRNLTQPFYMSLNGSGATITVAKITANDLSGLSAGTLVVRFRITAPVVNGGIIFQAGTDGTQNVMVIKNQNNTNQQFRYNFRAGGTGVNNDITGFTYMLNQWYTVALRYTGAAIEFWIDGNKISSAAASGTFATITGNWQIGGMNMDVWFARAWTSSLSNTNLTQAMANNYSTGSAINMQFIEGTGTPVEYANGATVTLNSTPPWSQLYTRGLGSFGLDFNTNSQCYVSFGSGSIVNQNSPVSVSLWILRKVLGNTERVLGRYTGVAWDIEMTSGNNVNFNFFGGPGHSSNGTITDTKTWHNIICTYNASLGSNQIAIYIDGSLDKQFTEGSSLTATTATFEISNNSSNMTHSLIDDVRIFNTALAQSDVNNLYARNSTQPSGLILWAKLNEGTGITAFDSSGNGVNGTFFNSGSTSSGSLPLWVPTPLYALTRTVVT